MARSKKTSKSSKSTSVRVERVAARENLGVDFSDRRSMVNLVLGVLVVIALAVLLFNYFTKNPTNNQGDLGPSQQTANTQTQNGDVAKENLPGKYTVKEGDTLFSVAQKYYDDGYKFDQLAKANNLTDVNTLTVGQVLDIPKLDNTLALASTSPNATTEPQSSPDQTTNPAPTTDPNQGLSMPGSGGATNETIWGEKIDNSTYTVQEGDWLSKIAGRAYGDVMSYQKIAQANNITNPDLIEPGMVLKIPR